MLVKQEAIQLIEDLYRLVFSALDMLSWLPAFVEPLNWFRRALQWNKSVKMSTKSETSHDTERRRHGVSLCDSSRMGTGLLDQ